MRTDKRKLVTVAAALGLTATLAGVRIRHAAGQTPPVQLIRLGHGFTPDADFKAKADGPTEVEQDRIIFQPGAAKKPASRSLSQRPDCLSLICCAILPLGEVCCHFWTGRILPLR